MMVEQKAREILNNLNITCPPVDVERIASSNDINVFKTSLPDPEISGILQVYDSNSAIILINSLHHSNRQRFSIAHELGHFFLHAKKGIHIDKKTFLRDKKSSSALDNSEIEANKFAAELLMPRDFLLNEIKSRGIEDLIDTDEDIVKELAEKFRVSTTAMAIKIQTLGYSFGF